MKIFILFIDIADELILTEINAEDKDADTYFPTFNEDDYIKELIDKNNDDIEYKHVRYRRKK